MNNATTWVHSVFDSQLSSSSKLICLYLRTHMNDYREVAWPSVGRIAAKCSMSERTVQIHLKEIQDFGYLLANGSSPSGTTRYAISTPEESAPPQYLHPSPAVSAPLPPAVSAPELNNIQLNNISNRAFTPPTVKEVLEYTMTRPIKIDAEKFCDFYESKGWMVGKNRMRNWQAAVRNWEKGSNPTSGKSQDWGI